LQTDRRTRDRVRLFFWAVLTVVCLVAVMVARQQQEQGLQRKMEAAQERAVRFTQNVLAEPLDAKRVSQPIGRSGYDALLTELKHGLFNDQRVVRVRVWRDDGMLVFTTDHPGDIGSALANDVGVDLRPALRGDLTSVVVSESFARDDATTPEPTALLSTFIPLRSADKATVFGVVQIDNDYGLMVDATEHPWKQVQIAFAILALICLVMAIVSLIWSHRPVAVETDGFGPSRREVRAEAKEEKKASAAEAEAAKLRDRVKELEGKAKTHSEQQAELEKLRDRVAEFESRPAPAAAQEADPAEMAQLKAHASQLEEQARGAESRVTQLQSRVTEMEAQLHVTTDQLRMAQQRLEESEAAPAADVSPEIEAELRAKLIAAAEVEQVLRDELEAARVEAQRVQHERDELERAHAEEARSQQGQLDQVRAQARLAEEERQRILAEAAKSPTAREAVSADAESRIKELTQQLERSEAERAMLRAGRPETVYEARNRQLEDEIAALRERLEGPGPHGAPPTNIDPAAFAALESRLVAAEERARDAERRLDEAAAKPRSRSRASRRANAEAEAGGGANGNGNGNGSVDDEVQAEPAIHASVDDEPQDPATPVDDGPPIPTEDGSELRSRLVRSTDARRRGISTPTATPTPGPKRR